MKTLSALVEREAFEVPAFALDHFQRKVREACTSSSSSREAG